MRTERRLCGLLTAATAAAAIVPTAALGDGYFRCGQSLVSADMSLAELVRKCGEPKSKEVSFQEARAYIGGWRGVGTEKIGDVRVETWRYAHSDRQDGMVVTVVEGKIVAIESP